MTVDSPVGASTGGGPTTADSTAGTLPGTPVDLADGTGHAEPSGAGTHAGPRGRRFRRFRQSRQFQWARSSLSLSLSLSRFRSPAGVVAVVALLSFVASLVLRVTLYPEGSGDADEAAYILQARMLLEGRLTLDAGAVEPFFRPWLTGVHDGRVFTKYLPGWPALLALSQALFGTMAVAPAAVAGVWVVGTYRLARELFDHAWSAVAAAVGVALSPLVLLHTALPLAYAPGAAVLVLASAELLRGARTGARAALAGGGAGLGLVLLIRPFDVVLVVLPVIVLAAVRRRRELGTLLRRSGWAVIGALPLVVALLAYCWRVTGSPLRMPLSASDPLDRFGFGPRRILPSESSFLFTRRLALDALQETLEVAPSWFFGGAALIALAAVGLVAPRRRLERLFLLATTGVVLAGYTFWWGSAFAMPGLRNGLGPHYHLAAFTPVVILAADGARWLWTFLPARSPLSRRPGSSASGTARGLAGRMVRSGAVAVAVAGLVAITVPTLQPRIDVQRGVNEGNDFLAALLPDDLGGPAVVLVTPTVPSRYTQVPYHSLRNSPDLDGPVVFAADIGPGSAALPDRMPDRAMFRLRPDEIADPAVPGSFRGSFVPLRQVTGSRVEIRVQVRIPGDTGTAPVRSGDARLYVRLGGEVRTPRTAVPVTITHTFVLTTGPGTGPDEIGTAGASLPAELVVGFTDGTGPASGTWEERFPLVRSPGGDLSLLAPGLGWRRLPTGAGSGTDGGTGGQWLPATAKPTLDVSLTGGAAR
ncbi:hypothetical protein BBK14_18720 [Parafrankia soli]|uniref:DUF7846 domain-containing protein n=1 Tax=Parafrankia soli TaxID=2599596 RepID=A0A1S1Q4F2_9ACTN|nr:DUF6541 family protein [Parafrankia soli]OHV27992.1 hypothetical protein BBK14_18720 [Parafrankia soli]